MQVLRHQYLPWNRHAPDSGRPTIARCSVLSNGERAGGAYALVGHLAGRLFVGFRVALTVLRQRLTGTAGQRENCATPIPTYVAPQRPCQSASARRGGQRARRTALPTTAGFLPGEKFWRYSRVSE
jgi:hypothetical protein